MNANRTSGFTLGLLAMAGIHFVLVARWAAWFGGAYRPWFLNSGPAVAFTITTLFVVSLIAGWFQIPGLSIATGAFVGMTLVMFVGDGGAGTIFPIALGAGALFIAGATVLGAWLGSEIGRWIYPRR